jgi:hypothetical protein
VGDALRATSTRRPVLRLRLLHFHFAGAGVETVYIGRFVVRIVVNRASSITELAPVFQVLIGAISLAGGICAWSRQGHYRENDAGQA